jgi:formate dehydrogenase major subunit
MTNHFEDYVNSDYFLIIGANPAEAHPMAMRHIGKAKAKGAKIIVVDPRFTKTAAHADIYVPIRPGTDIAFLHGLINYAIQNDLYQHEYVLNYTNASYLINPDYSFTDGVFSGLEEKDGKLSYNNASWSYQTDGEDFRKDPTLQDPQCVWQIMKKHVSRYDIKTVSNVTGTPEDTLQKAYALYCKSGKPEVSGNLIYVLGITQHSYGAQNTRATCMVQLLLGNVGLPGGGLNPQRGQSNVQGACDMGMLWNNVTGYLKVPDATKHATYEDYLKAESPKTGYWSNTPKFMTSTLKAWYGEKATKENDFCFDWLPKTEGKSHSHMDSYAGLEEGEIKGVFCWAENPSVAGPDASHEVKALEKADWMVCVDVFENETAAFWKRPGVNPADIQTEVFLLPAAHIYEKNGTRTNSSRDVQWRWKAVEPPGQAKSDLWIADRLYKAIRKEYESGGKFIDPIMNLTWNYDKPGQDEPDVEKVAIEINGFKVEDGTVLGTFADLKDDGSTACGVWIYAGYYYVDPKETDPLLKVPATKRHGTEDKTGLAIYPKWTFAWPLNRRIVYNRCSSNPAGQPWNPKRAYIFWDGAKWVTPDVPDFGAKDAKTKEPNPPEKTAHAPFIMTADGQAHFFVPSSLISTSQLKEGPMPEHYEPVESPVKNPISKQQNNPVAKKWKGEFSKLAEVGSKDFPYVATTVHYIEHYQTGVRTRNSPYLVELMPEQFATISPGLANQLGIKPGDDIIVSSARAEITCKANVLPIVQPLVVNGSPVEIVSLPWSWGFMGLSKGAIGNELTPFVACPNVTVPEYKAFLVNVRKA